MSTLFLTCFIFIPSCAHLGDVPSVYINKFQNFVIFSSGEKNLKNHIETVKKDITYIENVSNHMPYFFKRLDIASGHKGYFEFFSAFVRKIKIIDGECAAEEVACSYLKMPGIIFLSSKYFKLNSFSRSATLLHEAYHHFEKHQTKHVKCANKWIKNSECDSNLKSAYGLEVVFLQDALLDRYDVKNTDIPKLKRELKLAILRINEN